MSEGPPFHDLSCLVHVHSTYSDGTATVRELLDEARRAGADALLLTDHDSLGARDDGWEGDHDGVFLMAGVEVSPKRGHYLAFGIDQPIEHRGLSPREIAASVRAAGGVGFAAHPLSSGGQMLIPGIARRIVRPHDWPALEEDGTDGIELWSVLTDAAEGWRTPAEAVRWLRNPEAAVAAGPPARQLQAWDALSARRSVPAVGGLDDHQRGFRLWGRVRSPVPHWRTFRLLRTHLLCERPLSGEVRADRETIVGALRAGSAWLHCPFVAPAHGARLWADGDDGATIRMGGETPAGRRSLLRVRLPREAEVVVRRNGEAIERASSARLDLEIHDAGAYRVEARIDGRFWLLSNPVHLR